MSEPEKQHSKNYKYYLKHKNDPEIKKQKAISDHNYYLKHKDECLNRIKRYLSKNKDKVAKYRNKYRNEIIQLLGVKCANPYNIDHTSFERELDYIFCLQIDHTHGHGKIEIDSFSHDRKQYYKHILEEIKSGSKDYQLLCANCNWLKRHKNNENGK
jgi:hypothetical protein